MKPFSSTLYSPRAGRVWWSDNCGRYMRLRDLPLSELTAIEVHVHRSKLAEIREELRRRRVGWGAKA